MKRLRGWLFNFAAIASLALSFAMLGLWVRSYVRSDRVHAMHVHGSILDAVIVYSGRGAIYLGVARNSLKEVPLAPNWRPIGYIEESDPGYPGDASIQTGWKKQFAGFGALSGQEFSIQSSEHGIWAPHWFVALTAGLFGMWALNKHRRQMLRARAGLCLHCGYDLRATPDRCPECGTSPSRKELA